MVAGGADLGGGGADHDVTAVAALPDLDLGLLEDLGSLDILQQGTVALLVVLLDGGDQTELACQLIEALLFGGLGEAGIHVGPLVVLALGGGEQVLGGIADAAQLLEPQLGVLLLVVGGLQEQGRDLLVALLLCLGSKVGILVAGLGLTSESGHQVLLGLGACVLVAHNKLLHHMEIQGVLPRNHHTHFSQKSQRLRIS